MPIYVGNTEFALRNTEVMWISHYASTRSRADLAAVKVLGKESHVLQKGRDQRGVRNNCLNVDYFLGYSSYLG